MDRDVLKRSVSLGDRRDRAWLATPITAHGDDHVIRAASLAGRRACPGPSGTCGATSRFPPREARLRTAILRVIAVDKGRARGRR
jgi:hypothetical protein